MSDGRRKMFTPDASAVAAEPLVKLGTQIPRRLNKLLDLECAEREIQKRELVTKILEAYFASKRKPAMN